jgi:3-methyladenine DNA glycosylase AlkD
MSSTAHFAQTAGVVRALAAIADPARAEHAQRYFKTGEGDYGAGDVFIGVTMPDLRTAIRAFRGLPLHEIGELLDSDVHEHRMAGVLLLVDAYKTNPAEVFDSYIAAVSRGRVNNWDLVDASAEFIVGPHLLHGDRSLLTQLAASPSLWERRVAVLATFHFIKQGDPSTTLDLAERLLTDREDLMQKAVGWMLREIGKRVSRDPLIAFLDAHAAQMPRTMLSYATEHLTPDERARYRAMR